MNTFVFRDGKFELDEGYDRGPMIVYSDQEWQRRVDEYIRNAHIRWMLKSYSLMLAIPTILLLAGIIGPGTEASEIFILVAEILFLIITLMALATTWYGLHAISQSPLYGLYEKGFQHNYRSFYPYEEIEKVEFTTKGRYDEEIPYLHLRKGPDKTASSPSWGPVLFLPYLLGRDGIDELIRRIDSVNQSTEPVVS